MNQGSSVPDDIVASILPRLPAKSLVRFKYLSKSWFSFLSQLKLGNKKLIFSTLCYLQSIDCEAPNSNMKALRLNFPYRKLHNIQLIGSCNGLICMLEFEKKYGVDMKDAVVLWNPLMGTYKRILLPSPLPRISADIKHHQFGFGYDKSTDDYKILRVIPCALHFACYDPLLLNMYSFKTDSWKTKRFPLPFHFSSTTHPGIFMDGALYWYIRYPKLNSSGVMTWIIGDGSPAILRYDFMDENFSVIQLPDNVAGLPDIHLREFGGHLCMFNSKSGFALDIWKMEKKENSYNWINWMRIPFLEGATYVEYLAPLYFMKDGQVLITMLTRNNTYFTDEFHLYSPGEKKFRKIKIEGIEPYLIFHREFLYQETLISPILLKTKSHSPPNQDSVDWKVVATDCPSL